MVGGTGRIIINIPQALALTETYENYRPAGHCPTSMLFFLLAIAPREGNGPDGPKQQKHKSYKNPGRDILHAGTFYFSKNA
jgi:hypothetical protein